MSLTFQPAVYSDGSLLVLPRPVTRLRLQNAWDAEQFKVPLSAGDVRGSASANGIDILVEGQFSSAAGSILATEAEMLAAVESLRAALSPSGFDARYEFFLYHDTGSDTYRKFSGCTTARFESDLSEASLFTYSLVVHAENPTLLTTAPGS
ncbi:hypothetical protein [Stratiformator vulcanicus]|uniref:Uncharacterized protein n=1 Tax=Stratiformator vulcanicus TaxID=2527980 RepID=A0A517QWZ8_9PLAN|nr:hypothetical protein [Stratiformator vulcanicus]QDT36100.1 hypothetical protein Pan189_04550 [Stratiformator vulcanicus]